jgi:excisionase family DNA binding protein
VPASLVLKVRDGDGESEVQIPAEVVPFLVEILGQLANGNSVRVVPVHAELTTQQAADLLNTSRPYLIKVLEAGGVPFSLVGTHRRIKLGDILAYKRARDADRRSILDELSVEGQEQDLG